ncbi:hypothetical protein HD842_002525 [Massilia aurea]|uniref:Uncharacterized protein n=1 Tax=Massilia aurea TaxID=373040 RepID=A0A7X0CET9_9BURK|nr:hypothetical protein [Massilia aurea]MBB6134383.1 hypothetical protein [Massilia aurea]
MRESRMDRGQQFGCRQKPGFCTVDAVDMQALVHRTFAPGRWLSVIDADWQSQIAGGFVPTFFFLKNAFRTMLSRASGERCTARELSSLFT